MELQRKYLLSLMFSDRRYARCYLIRFGLKRNGIKGEDIYMELQRKYLLSLMFSDRRYA
jgi:hypothetical protein